MSITIDVSEVVAKLDPEAMKKALGGGIQRAITRDLRPEVAQYPGKANKPMRWASEKQRRWFFWALRTGQISVPYARTGQLGNRWLTKVNPYMGGWRGELRSQTPYAKYVISEGNQAYIHEGRWWTLTKVAERKANAVRDTIAEELVRWAR